MKNSELNGTKITLNKTEDFTKCRSELLYQAKQRVKTELLLGAWSSYGRILVKGHDGKNQPHFVIGALRECTWQ